MINIIAINIIGGNIFFSIHLDVRWSTLIFITYIVFNFFKKLLLYTIIFDKNYFIDKVILKKIIFSMHSSKIWYMLCTVKYTLLLCVLYILVSVLISIGLCERVYEK